jgi:hypothetical protein
MRAPRKRATSRRVRFAALLVVLVLSLGVAAAIAASTTITRSHALAVANAINLRHADLPSLTQQSNPITKQETASNAQLTKCTGGEPNSDALALAQSPDFVTGGTASATLSSEVEIAPTVASAKKDLASIVGSRGLPCLQNQLTAELRAGASKGETLSVHGAIIPSGLSGSDGSFAVRLTITVHVTKGKTVVSEPIYGDEIGFLYGQAEVSLNDVEINGQPSLSLLHRLAAVLLSRARTAVG